MSWFKAYSVAIVSMLAGAAVVHNVYQPDLRITVGEVAAPEEAPQPASSD